MSTANTPLNVCVIGLWHLGTVTAVCLADWGCRVIGVDWDAERIAKLQQGIPPLYEPGLEELVQTNMAEGRLRFTTDIAEAVAASDFVWITYDTPVDEQDEADLTIILETVTALAPHLRAEATVLISSQVPVGTCEELWGMIGEQNAQAAGGIVYIPENLRLGPAIERFRQPDMVVIGCDRAEAGARAELLLGRIDAPKMTVDVRTAEMVKHAINTFLATTISLANELGNLSEKVGADGLAVARAMKLDSRIGKHARVLPGLGFAGGTLARDLKTLKRIGALRGEPTSVIDAVLDVNAAQNSLVVRRLAERYELADCRIGVLGLTYTPNTSTLRRSSSIEMIRELTERGAAVQAFDPKADLSELEPDAPAFTCCEDAYKAAAGCDALVIMTEWPEFRELDFARIAASMRTPLLFDAKNCIEPSQAARSGLDYLGIGRKGGVR